MAKMKERLHEILDILSSIEMQTFEYAEEFLNSLGYSKEEISAAFKWYIKSESFQDTSKLYLQTS